MHSVHCHQVLYPAVRYCAVRPGKVCVKRVCYSVFMMCGHPIMKSFIRGPGAKWRTKVSTVRHSNTTLHTVLFSIHMWVAGGEWRVQPPFPHLTTPDPPPPAPPMTDVKPNSLRRLADSALRSLPALNTKFSVLQRRRDELISADKILSQFIFKILHE